MSHQLKKRLFFLAVVLVAIAAVFGQSLFHGFSIVDDEVLIFENQAVQKADFQRLLRGDRTEYIPVTQISFIFNQWLFGSGPLGFHLVNLCLHLMVALLLALLLKKVFSGERHLVLLGTLLFALHPLNVEPVVWVAGRKDLLATVFILASCLFYWTSQTSPKKSSRVLFYVAAFFFALLALGSKGIAVGLPLLWCLVDLLRGEQSLSKKLILNKIPVFIPAVFVLFRHLQSHQSFSVMSGSQYSAMEAFGDALQALVFYLSKSLWPSRLSLYYERSAFVLTAFEVTVAIFVLGAFAFLWMKRREIRRTLFLGLLWAGICLVPYLKLVPYGSDFIVADRYFYLASLGLILAFLASIQARVWAQRITLVGLCFFAGLSFLRVTDWRDNEVLLQDALTKYPRTSYAYQVLGILSLRKGQSEQAIEHYRQAVALKPTHEAYLYDLATIHLNRGELNEAVKLFEKITEPSAVHVFVNMASVYQRLGNDDKASSLLEAALVRHHYHFAPYFNLALLRRRQGRLEEAQTLMEQARQRQGSWARIDMELSEIAKARGDEAAAQSYLQSASQKSQVLLEE